jgi:hypothetical protein
MTGTTVSLMPRRANSAFSCGIAVDSSLMVTLTDPSAWTVNAYAGAAHSSSRRPSR